MKKHILIAAALLVAAPITPVFSPITAPEAHAQDRREGLDGYYDDRGRWREYSRREKAEARERCERDRQKESNKGAIVGGLAGAVLGGAVSGKGAKTEGAVVGGVGGALAGRQISNKNNRC